MAESQAVVIVGVGLTTPVGLSAAETAASVRASTMAMEETDFRDHRFDRVILGEVPDEGLAPLAEAVSQTPGVTAREERMLRLATNAMRECVAPLQGRRLPLGICLALPELETTLPLDGGTFLRRLALQVGGIVHPAGSDASHRGRAGGVIAIGQAVLTIERGIANFIIAGGVDTHRDAYILGTLDLEHRLKSNDHHDGFIPGEGAGFLLLASERAAAAEGLPVIARLSGVAMGFEAGHLYSSTPYRGDGLASAIAQIAAAGAAPVGEVYSSMNGESHWAKEWGVSFIRNRAAFAPDYGMHHPADCFGDTGAACGPLMAGLAALGIRGSYRRPPALVYGSSDRGARAAVMVTA